MSKQIKFGINVESNGKKVFSGLSVGLKDLEGVIKAATNRVKGLRKGFDKIAPSAAVFTAANTALSNLRDMMEY